MIVLPAFLNFQRFVFYLIGGYFIITQITYSQEYHKHSINSSHNNNNNEVLELDLISKKSQIDYFFENLGQIKHLDSDIVANEVAFDLTRGNVHVFILREGGIAWQINKFHYPEGYEDLRNEAALDSLKLASFEKMSKDISIETYRMDMILVGANPTCKIEKNFKSNDYLNFIEDTISNLYHFKEIIFKDIYPGINWVVNAEIDGVKQSFVVTPGADPNLIKMKFTSQEEILLDMNGNLLRTNKLGTFLEEAPVSFQKDKVINTKFVLKESMVSFELGEYNYSEVLIIDPLTRYWGTFFGGLTGSLVYGNGCGTDMNGNVFLSGSHYNVTGLSTPGAFQTSLNNLNSVGFFVSKFDSFGNRIWTTYSGGSSSINAGNSFKGVCDQLGNYYFAGWTNSAINSLSFTGHQTIYSGNTDGFIVKFSSSGSLVWASYYGGPDFDRIYDLTTDLNNNLIVVGTTDSDVGIATIGAIRENSYLPGSGYTDGFIVKFNPNGTRLWSSYIGGTDIDFAHSCAVNSIGEIFVSGLTRSSDVYMINSYQSTPGGGYDAFFAKISSSGGNIIWSSYYGGSSDEGTPAYLNLCSADSQGNLYLAGSTSSFNNISSVGSFQTSLSNSGSFDLYLAKFNTNGSRIWATYKGINYQNETLKSLKVLDSSVVLYGNATLTSGTGVNFSTNGAFQTVVNGGAESFLSHFDNLGNQIETTYFGGSGTEWANDMCIDYQGSIYIVGSTSTTNFPQTIASTGSFQSVNTGSVSAYLVKFAENIPLNVDTTDFYYECVNQKTYLKWSSNDANSNYYLIEASIDGLIFQEYANVATISSSNSKYEYEIQDNIKNQYFRLSQIDFDGVKSSLSTIMVNYCFDYMPFSIYPNPILYGCLSILNPDELAANIEIISREGKVVLHNEYSKGIEKIEIPVESIVNGIYYLTINEFTFTILIEN